MTDTKDPKAKATCRGEQREKRPSVAHEKAIPKEIGGPKGLEPTRYGDWERNGRCSDF